MALFNLSQGVALGTASLAIRFRVLPGPLTKRRDFQKVVQALFSGRSGNIACFPPSPGTGTFW
ncbi:MULTISPECIES: hypothetical protein [Pseudomonas]|uniref:Uncharacterized protein n=1 Tax=Pseudomonas piscis TaxID=2614538 RepID=A0ABY9NJ36_9PSED|nr:MULTISPECIES: hypothetical protein [Pseudomonas]WMN18563.1 hypothetical protein QL104_03915 [Pseudomonas piscis]